MFNQLFINISSLSYNNLYNLFNIFIEPLLRYLNKSELGYKFETLDNDPIKTAATNFADDTTLKSSSKESLNKLFNMTEKYLHHHSMALNYKKCEFVSNDYKHKSNTLKSIITTEQIQDKGKLHKFRHLGLMMSLE